MEISIIVAGFLGMSGLFFGLAYRVIQLSEKLVGSSEKSKATDFNTIETLLNAVVAKSPQEFSALQLDVKSAQLEKEAMELQLRPTVEEKKVKKKITNPSVISEQDDPFTT